MAASNQCLPLATAPFDRTDADILLRSEDQVYFRVHRTILAIASSVFESMFALPDPVDGSGGGDETIGGIRVVQLAEHAEHLDTLLRFCYPATAPEILDLGAIQTIIGLAQKYDMESVAGLLRKQLVALRFLEKEPLRVFAIACHYRLVEETKLAAYHTLRHPMIPPYIDELTLINASAFHRLLSYRQTCQNSANLVTRHYAWAKTTWVGRCGGTTCGRMSYYVTVGGEAVRPAAWWDEIMNAAGEVLSIKPYGGAVRSPAAFVPVNSVGTMLGCSSCRQNALHNLDAMCKALAEEVDRCTMQELDNYTFE